MDLYARLSLNTDGYDEGLDHASQSAGGFGEKIKNGLATAAKIGGAALAAAATGIAALTKQSIEGYAEYEQLVGGVETLYGASAMTIEEYAASIGKSSDEVGHEYEMMMSRQEHVMENAANAYKTAGLSANEYMNTVNGFAASLTSSLGEYGWQAAGYADMIVTDMADNANKMGTSMESIQNAYSGFAKQNYTMLDNLKLGYGGTKEEMERLLRDAEQYAGFIEGSLNVESFADVATAINIVQNEMGITGTTAKEAGATIQGSIGMMKSAWQNFITGMADPEQDFGALVGNVVDSVVTVANNLVPRIQELLPRLVEGLSQVATGIVGYIPDTLKDILPVLIDSATSLVEKLVEFLPELISTLLPTVVEGITSVLTSLIDALPDLITVLLESLPMLIQAAMQIMIALVTGIAQNLPTLIPQIVQTAMDIINVFVDNISLFIDAGIQLLVGLITGFVQALPILIAELPNIISKIITAIIDNFDTILDAIITIVPMLVSALIENLPVIIEGLIKISVEIITKLPEIILKIVVAVVELIAELGTMIWDALPELWDTTLAPWFEELWTGISDWFTQAWEDIGTFFDDLFTGIGDWFTGLWEGFTGWLDELWTGVSDWFSGIWDSIVQLGSDIINGIWEGLKSAWTAVSDWFTGIWEGIFGSSESVPVDVSASVQANMPAYASGTDYHLGGLALVGEEGPEIIDMPRSTRVHTASETARMLSGDQSGALNEITVLLKQLLAKDTTIELDGHELGRAVSRTTRQYETIAGVV